MPRPGRLEKAELTELWPDDGGQLAPRDRDGGAPKRVRVQFNPQTLRVSLSNQGAGGDQPGGSAVQFVGAGTTKLSLELWFDVQLPLPDGADDAQGDVRNLTKEIAFFMTPQTVARDGAEGLLPPAVEFLWGSFLFKGVVESMEETLEHFSEDGRPLRASVSLSLAKQDLKFEFGAAGGSAQPGAAPAAGTQPLLAARAGESVQSIAARLGVADWKSLAAANGIENPRLLAPGTLLRAPTRASGRPPFTGS